MAAKERILEIGTSPHIATGASVEIIMRNVVYALLPVCVYSIYVFGLTALITLTAATASCLLTEYVLGRWSGRGSTLGDWSVAVTGIIYGLTLPPGLPVWMTVLGGVAGVGVGKFLFGGLGYNAFNPALVGPGERVRIERIGAAPDRGAARCIEHAHAGPATTARALGIAPLEFLELPNQPCHTLEPHRVDRLRALVVLDPLGNACERDVIFANILDNLCDLLGIAQVDLAHELRLHGLLELAHKLVDVLHVLLDARLHQRFDGRDKQVHDGLLGTTKTGAVTARK